jgi:DNA-directed RNA polymerase subunit L
MSESKVKNKPSHITNIRYPHAKTWDKRNTYVEFELANVNVSTANAIRRIMIAHVKTVGFRTEPYKACELDIKQNDTPLHNQFILHRLAMVPINVPKPDSFDADDYLFIINVENNTNTIKTITTEDFQIKQISSNKFLSKDEVKRFFPPDAVTGNYVLLDKLRPKFFIPSKHVSREVVAEMAKDFTKPTDDVMRFHVEGKASISNGAENGHFSPVACACYINTVDPQKAAVGLKEYIDKHHEHAKLRNITPMTDEQLARRFELTERARYFYTNDKNEANVFTYKIETVGVIPSLVIFHRAIDILKDKITNFVSNIVSRNESEVTITPSKQLEGGFDIVVNNEDDTLGNIIQAHMCIMYADFTLPKEQRKLKYIGYKRPHPLEKHIIFLMQGKTDSLEELIGDVIKPGCAQIIKMLNKIQSELEGTGQFVAELKMIN